MSIPIKRLFLSPRALRPALDCSRVNRHTYATIPTKNPNPTPPIEPSNEQAMPLGRFYEHILNKPPPYEDKKPEAPATSALEESGEVPPQKATATRGRKAAAAAKEDKPTPEKSAKEDKSTASSISSSSSSSTGDSGSKSKTAAAAPPASVSTSPPIPTPPPTSAQDKAKVIFGSGLAGPAARAERLAEKKAQSRRIEGILVPPKPEEPDHCCMSGCVNCVWDLYRDEMELWAAANAEVEAKLAAQRLKERQTRPDESSVLDSGKLDGTSRISVSMDDDGGGSETNWDTSVPPITPERLSKNFWDEELYRNVPVGIREFMKQEKRLKMKHERDGTSGG